MVNRSLAPGSGTLRGCAAGYHRAGLVWNAMVDRRPAVIVCCASVADVAAAVGFAQAQELEVGVRCGGQSVLGISVPVGGLMVDLTPLHTVRVDPDRLRAWVAGGALLGDLDRPRKHTGWPRPPATSPTLASAASPSVAGWAGWHGDTGSPATTSPLPGRHRRRRDPARQPLGEPDPDWGLRGGGGNFGVVTEFESDLHQVDTKALVVDLSYPPRDSAAMQRWRGLIPDAPRQATFTAWVGTTGATPWLPLQAWNRPMAAVGYAWVGDPDQGRRLLPALRAGAAPMAERVVELSYLELQRVEDEQQRHRLRRYWKGRYLRELSDDAVDAFLSRGGGDDPALLPSGSLQHYGGAVAQVRDAETAFSHRDALVEFVAVAGWSDPGGGPAADVGRPPLRRRGRAVFQRRTRQRPRRRGAGGRPARLRGRQAGAAGRAERTLRPRQPLPPQPQHPPQQPGATVTTRATDHPAC
jgi:hypothetical protein